MKLWFMPEAEDALLEIAAWVEERNTPGSGIRFIHNFIDKMNAYALPNVLYAVCKNKVLAAYQLRCLVIDKWVIAFTQSKEEFVVHYILYGPGLK